MTGKRRATSPAVSVVHRRSNLAESPDQLSEDLPHEQHISSVYTNGGSKSFVGLARNVHFHGSSVRKDASQRAARKCLDALFLTNPEVDRERLISTKGTRVPGTCEWITRNEHYCAWLNDDTQRLLWISGGPGKGKTMISIFLTEQLDDHTKTISDAKLVYLFCSAEDGKRNTAVAVLRGLVHQIILKRPQLAKHALPYFNTNEKTKETLSSLETLWIIFRELLVDAELGTIFCVLDGLDECEESTPRLLLRRMVTLLRDKTPPSTSTFKVAFISRHMPGFQGCPRVRLDPDNDENVISDIELFIAKRVEELSEVDGFDETSRVSVQKELLKRAEGTFLWVGFAAYELSQQQTCSDIFEVLEDLPSGLPAIYSRVLLLIPAKRRDMSRTILRWVTMAIEPLRVRDIAVAVGIRPVSSSVTSEQAMLDALAYCGPLLKIEKEGVGLVHQSVRDYLLYHDDVPGGFHLDFESSHLELAQRCLDCIMRRDTDVIVLAGEELKAEAGPQTLPLKRYATLHWFDHAKGSTLRVAQLFESFNHFFFEENDPLRDQWWKDYKRLANVWKYSFGFSECLLHVACFPRVILLVVGLIAFKSWDLSNHDFLNVKYKLGETVLHILLRSGSPTEAIAQRLLDQGADIHAKDDRGQTVLHSAALSGNEAIVQLLLNEGANIHAKKNDGETVLHSAVYLTGNKTEAVVQLLIRQGSNVRAKNQIGQTVLHYLVYGSKRWEEVNEAVLQLLIDSGADLEAKDDAGDTVLHCALQSPYMKGLADRLIGKGADVHAKNSEGRTALEIYDQLFK